MKTNYLLFGFLSKDLEQLAEKFKKYLKIDLMLHDSLYIGEYYLAKLSNKGEFILQYNYNEYEKDWTEPDFKEYPIILYISKIRLPDELKNKILTEMNKDVVLLRQEEL